MRRPRFRNRHDNQPQIRLAADEIRLTNEEILGDLLYPAPAPPPAGLPRRKVKR